MSQLVGRLKIIGGKWRGRTLLVADRKALRPTPNRIRETLFNWLRMEISGAKCLDLFAGSGALGIEAVSRGASSATLVEQNKTIVAVLQQSLNIFGIDNNKITVHHAEALQWIESVGEKFDIIFLDPPFGSGLVEQSLLLLLRLRYTTRHCLIYVESDVAWQPISSFELVKQAKASQVHYALLKVISD